ncbi:SnoaL-like domain-containing protein [Actinacidiphila yanglinensis]|uniref:SnoaL-like domain-containing protein n=1 Tax=Actinacidiphila yanglinensis TaxID=310779 RepID=A0A1H6E7C2_9ACTN|nr:nuclear transport factor 2 family protein [Actinacidiphila yanglinensis]SEG93567.1 SnoaL-like domain-containing protein [Actinacidiphila yanglinensis]
MSLHAPPADSAQDTALYQEVQRFYAHQMRSLDEGDVDSWVATFTEDGVFSANAHPEPQEGREAIREGATAATRKLAEAKIRRRHWLGMLDVAANPDGTVRAVTYAQIIATPLGGTAQLELSCTCEDLLVREGGRLLVRHRQVYRDDLARS